MTYSVFLLGQLDLNQKAMLGAWLITTTMVGVLFLKRNNEANRRLNEAAEKLRRREESKKHASNLLSNDKFRDGIYLLRGLWIEDKNDEKSFINYIKSTCNIKSKIDIVLAHDFLNLITNDFNEFKSTPNPDNFCHDELIEKLIKKFETELLADEKEERKNKFESNVISKTIDLTKTIKKTNKIDDLENISSDLLLAMKQWGEMSSSENETWGKLYDKFSEEYTSRNNEINDQQLIYNDTRDKDVVNSLTEKVYQIKKRISSTEKKSTLDKIAESINELTNEADSIPSTNEHLHKLQEAFVFMKNEFNSAEARIISELKRKYNHWSVEVISTFISEIDKKRRGKVSDIAKDLAKLDAMILEPAILQYYQVTVAKALQIFDDAEDRDLMDAIATSEKLTIFSFE